MKEIDEYLNLVYKHLNTNEQEIANSKAEMKVHLLESVHELEIEGKSTDESVKIAIERFGDPRQIGKELPKVLVISRRRFSKLLLVITGIFIFLIVSISLMGLNNLKKQEKLQESEAIRETLIRELQQSQIENQDNKQILLTITKLSATYKNNPGQLNKDLKAKYNISTIDQIAEMNKTFKYHNGVLIAIAVIASETNYECPYYKDIAELAVMKLQDSMAVINLAEKVREAKTTKDKEYIQNQIRQMKAEAEFKTYQEALDYNIQIMNP